MNKLNSLDTLHGRVTLPTFFPDGTRGVVKSVDSLDLEKSKVEGLVINTYHLLVHGMVDKIQKFSGIHHFMNWKSPIITDSGGFQVMSLIHDHPGSGKITDDGVIFKYEGRKIILTPEKSIQTQLELDCDVAIVLDDCVRPSEASAKEAAELNQNEESVRRTISWAKRSKDEFNRLTKATRPGLGASTPLLFAVVQGGNNKKLRKYCAQELIKIGFDGYCFGGFPVDSKGKFLTEIVKYVASLLPDDKPKYALGVGKPEDIIKCVKMGYGIFDCVIPTREARHGKLYIFTKNSHITLDIKSGKYKNDPSPVSKDCDCLTCQNYSKAYLNHLFKIGDSLAGRLATIHNLRFYSMLMEQFKLNR